MSIVNLSIYKSLLFPTSLWTKTMLVRVTRGSQERKSEISQDDLLIIHTRFCNETGMGQWKSSTIHQWLFSAAIQLYLAQDSSPTSFLSHLSCALKQCFTLFKHKTKYIHLHKWYTSKPAPLHPGEGKLELTRPAPDSHKDLRLKSNCCFILLIAW